MLNVGAHSYHSIRFMIIFITQALSGIFDLILAGLSIAMPITCFTVFFRMQCSQGWWKAGTDPLKCDLLASSILGAAP